MRTEPDFLITTLSEREKGVLRTIGTREFVASAKFIMGADEADNTWLIEQIKQLYEQYFARVQEYWGMFRMASRMNFKLIPRMVTANVCEIVFALPDGQTKVITQIMFPADGQMNDNLEAAQGVCDILRKRIRKSLAC